MTRGWLPVALVAYTVCHWLSDERISRDAYQLVRMLRGSPPTYHEAEPKRDERIGIVPASLLLEKHYLKSPDTRPASEPPCRHQATILALLNHRNILSRSRVLIDGASVKDGLKKGYLNMV